MIKLIRGGTVVNHDYSRRADVLLSDGIIAAIDANLEAPAGAGVIDAGGCYVMPGGIDPHTHLEFEFMGTVTADDFEWGTKAALSGGTTMVIDHCIPNPGQSLLAAYQDWRRKAEGAASDYGFHMAITWWDKQVFDEMETTVKTYGINTFKHFLAYKGALMVNDDEMYNSFLRCAGLGAMPLIHAENGDVVWHLQQHYLSTGVTGPEGHAYSRPPAVEGEATNRAIMIADMAGCPVYIVHTSSRDAHEAIARARAAGQRVFGEPIIQHLVLDEAEYRNKDWEYAAQRVMSPPFRTKDHRASLWAGLQAGSLQVVATDHCAFTTEQKRLGRTDFTKIPNGTGGLEDRMPVLWTVGVNTGRHDQRGICRRHLNELRAHPQRLPEERRGRGRLRRGSGHLGSEREQNHLGQEASEPHRLQRVRRLPMQRPAARDLVARRDHLARRRPAGHGRRRPIRGARPLPRRARRQRDLARTQRPAPRRTDGSHAIASSARRSFSRCKTFRSTPSGCGIR